MREFVFNKTESPSMENFNKRFSDLQNFANFLGSEYVWEKLEPVEETYIGESESTSSIIIWYYGGTPTYDNITYGKGVKAGADGAFQLTDIFKPTQAPAASYLSYWANLCPFYFQYSDGVIYKALEYNGYSDSQITFDCVTPVVATREVLENRGYVNSPDPNSYPVDDGYIYKALGMLGAAADGVKIVTGNYTGTGTYGASNPNSLTFDFVPKFIFFTGYQSEKRIYSCERQGTPSNNFAKHSMDELTTDYVSGAGFGYYSDGYPYGKKSEDGKTVYWYSLNGAGGQFNDSGRTFYYVAIG